MTFQLKEILYLTLTLILIALIMLPAQLYILNLCKVI